MKLVTYFSPLDLEEFKLNSSYLTVVRLLMMFDLFFEKSGKARQFQFQLHKTALYSVEVDFVVFNVATIDVAHVWLLHERMIKFIVR